jgi:diguanylate cyclase (GGDEF)-like protein/PAS domain S-box-containing protein
MYKDNNNLGVTFSAANSSVQTYTWVFQILGLAIAYFVTGKLGTFLAIPPGYATAIWPPSGIALAGILTYGYRVWPGIFLGSFLINLSISLVTSSPSETFTFFIISFAICSGASLQAVVGGYLVHRFAAFPNTLIKEKEVFLFFLFGGLFSTLVNSTLAVLTLVVAGKISTANFLTNWLTWWMGDTLGILIFAPLVLVWALTPRDLWRNRRMAITLPIIVMFVLTTIVVFYEGRNNSERLKLEFEQQATELNVALEKSILTHFNVLRSLGSFYAASATVERQEFRIFVADSLANLNGIQALGWNPRVLSSERDAFERNVKSEAYKDFQITEQNVDNRIVRAGNRPEYISVSFIEPYQGNENALGYDVYSDMSRREAIDRARDTGEIATTIQTRLVQEQGNLHGMLAFLPIYRNGLPHQSLDERRKNISGYVVEVLRGEAIVIEALKNLNRNGLSYRLIDERALAGDKIIFSSNQQELKPLSLQENGLFGRNFSLVSNLVIPVGGDQWRFEVVPTQDYFTYHRSNNAWLILLAGLILTSLVSSFVIVFSGRGSLLRGLVEERTSALAQSEERFRATFEGAPVGVAMVSLSGHFLNVNQGYCDLVGYSRDELLTMTIKQVSQLNYQSADRDIIRQVLSGKISELAVEKQYVRKTGELIWGNLSLKLIRQADSSPAYFVAVVENIERRKQAEAHMAKSLSLLNATLDSTHDAILVVDLNNAMVLHNQQFLDLWHISDEILAAKDDNAALSFVLNQLDDPAVFLNKVRELYATPEASSYDTLTFKNGKIIERFSIPQRIDGKVVGRVWSFCDITERKLAEQSLQRESEKNLALLHNASDGIHIIDINGNIIEISDSFCAMLGYRRDEMIGMNVTQWDAKFSDAECIRLVREQFTNHNRTQFETLHQRKDGTLLNVEISGFPLELDGKQVLFNSSRDITERKRIETALLQKEGYQRALIDNFPFMVWLKDTDSNYLAVNKVLAQAFGESEPDSVIGKNDFDFSPNELAENYRKDDRSVLALNERKIVEEEYIDYLGVRRWIETFKSPVIDDKGVMLGTVGFAQDISDRKKSEIDIRIAATAFESQECMMVTDAEGAILRINQAFIHYTGYTAEEAIGKNPRILKSDRHNANFYEAMWESINNTGVWVGEIWNRRKNGEVFPAHLSITVVRNAQDITTNYVSTFTDITLAKEAENEIKQLAFYDPLTGLPNRRLLQERLKPALASSQHSNRKGALLFIDLDNFKALNDTQGHDMGDLLLQQVAQRLESCVREGDTVARLGGDEFVVMLENLSEQTMDAAAQTEVIGNKILNVLNTPYQLATHEYHSTPSIGATLFIGHEQSIDDLLKQADIAMYQAKASGRNTLRFFDPQMQSTINVRVALESELRLAILENQFQLYYQAQVRHNQQVIGAEVLIRWQHPQRGLISPADFIPLAEETYLIVPIGQWVLEMACVQLKIWEEHEHTQHLQLAVNVSAHQFYQADFVERVSELLQRSAINPARLKLELTESLVLKNIDDTINKMHRLKKIGVHFSMDDFGTGYSSLSSLKKLPLDQLKIDQSFIRDIASDPDDAVIVQTIIAMANKLGMEVIAEGVETEAQRAFLEQNNCPLFQGYLFSKPVPIEQFDLLVLK